MSVLESAPPPTRPPPPRSSLQGRNKGLSVDLESINFSDDSQPSVRKRSMTLESRPSRTRPSSAEQANKEPHVIDSRKGLKQMANPHVIDSRNPTNGISASVSKPLRPPPPSMSAAPSATAGKVSPPHGDGTATVGAEGPHPHPPLRRRLSSDGSTHSLKRMSSSSSRGSREMSPLPQLIEGVPVDVTSSVPPTLPSRIITPPPNAPPPVAAKRQRSISTPPPMSPPPSSPPPILTPPTSPPISSPSTSSLPTLSAEISSSGSSAPQTTFPPTPTSASPPPTMSNNAPKPMSPPPPLPTSTSPPPPSTSPVNSPPTSNGDGGDGGDNTSTPVIPPRPYRPPRPFAPPSNSNPKKSGDRRGSAPSSSHNKVTMKVPKKSNTVRGPPGTGRTKSTRHGPRTSHDKDRDFRTSQDKSGEHKTSHDKGDPNKIKPGMSPLHKQVIIKSVDSETSNPASPSLVVTPVEDNVFETPTVGPNSDDQSNCLASPDQSLSSPQGSLTLGGSNSTEKRKKTVSFSEDLGEEPEDLGEEPEDLGEEPEDSGGEKDDESALPPTSPPTRTTRGWKIANSVRNISNSFRINRKKKLSDPPPPPELSSNYPDPLPESGCIHPIVVQCVAYLNRECVLEEQGLFRIPGDLATIRKLRQKFMQGNEVDLMDVLDPHTVAGLLKLHFRETKTSIIPRGAPLTDIMNHVRNRDVERVREEFNNLEEYTLATLSLVIEVMAKISSHSDKNFMTSGILATSSGPSIFPYLPPSNANQIMKFLIDNSSQIFL